MRKKIVFLLLVITTLILLTSCNSKTISNVSVNNDNYFSFYLYEFENANVSDYRLIEAEDEIPTSSGFIFSRENLEEDDTIKVWTLTFFGETGLGTNAKVVSKKSEYPIKVKANIDTYTITYYEFPKPYTYSSEIIEPTRHTIEVSKDNVIIEYK